MEGTKKGRGWGGGSMDGRRMKNEPALLLSICARQFILEYLPSNKRSNRVKSRCDGIERQI